MRGIPSCSPAFAPQRKPSLRVKKKAHVKKKAQRRGTLLAASLLTCLAAHLPRTHAVIPSAEARDPLAHVPQRECARAFETMFACWVGSARDLLLL
jgi:hypothetical protein